MKDTLLTSLRHAFTSLAGLGGYLVAHGAIGSADASAVNTAGAAIGDGLAVVAAALLARLVWWVSGRIVTGGAPIVAYMCVCTLAAGGLPACSPTGEYPVTASITYRDPHSGAKAGLSYSPTIRLKGGVTVPIYDAQTGELLGVTDVAIDRSSAK